MKYGAVQKLCRNTYFLCSNLCSRAIFLTVSRDEIIFGWLMGERDMRTTATCHTYIGFEYINKLVT